MKKILIIISLIFSVINVQAQGLEIDKVKRSIVTIDARISKSAYEQTGSFTATGFVADKSGLIVTNRHVIGGAGSIGTYIVTFHNGKQAPAYLVYYDQYPDFAILKVKHEDLPEDIFIAELSEEELKINQELFIVGNNEAKGFSYHSGNLSSLYEVEGSMPQGSYIINLNNVGGSSGSPVFNDNNKAVALVYGAGRTYALALKSSYIIHVIKDILNNQPISRKHIGVRLALYSLDKAVLHRNFPEEIANKSVKEFSDTRNRVLVVSEVLVSSPAENILIAGDIIWEIDGVKVGADLAKFDLIMSEKNKSEVKIKFYRNGKLLEETIKLYDLEKTKISHMYNFAGGIFLK